MGFRKDINSLRAIALIAVVLFHFKASWIPGGFAGVDVFFVISGFLMTRIIFTGMEQGNFSILKFYVARANRIIPALAVLCLVLISLGWFFLTHPDYKTLGKHVSGSMGFLSNVIYSKESGYFDIASSEKWLLHTWSLSVEWQFYMIYPIVLVAMRQFMSEKAMKATVVLGAVLGFIFCVIVTNSWPSEAYYLLPARAWEMMVGGAAYLYPVALKEERKKPLEWLGLSLIIGSYFFISKNTPWPGYMALLPVLGAFLIIQAQRDDSLIASSVIFQKIGDWSYSIYLWHWPVVVAIYYFSFSDMFIYLGVGLSILLGFFSYTYVEKIKFRNDFSGLLSYLKCKPIYIVIILGLMGVGLYKDTELHRQQPEGKLLGHNYINSAGDLVFNKSNEVRVLNRAAMGGALLMVGDSNSAHYSSGITASQKLKITHHWSGSCLAFLDMNTKPYASWMDKKWEGSCHSLYKFVDFNKQSPVIIAHQWREREMACVRNCTTNNIFATYDSTLKDELKKLIMYIGDRPIFIIGQVPAPDKTMVKCMRGVNRESCESLSPKPVTRVATNLILENISKLYDNVFFIDPFKAICNEKDGCNTIIDGENLFYDGVHLSAFGSKKIWPYIENKIIENLRK